MYSSARVSAGRLKLKPSSPQPRHKLAEGTRCSSATSCEPSCSNKASDSVTPATRPGISGITDDVAGLRDEARQKNSIESAMQEITSVTNIRPPVVDSTVFPAVIKKEGRKLYDSHDRLEIMERFKQPSGDRADSDREDGELEDEDDALIVLTPPPRSPESVVILTSDSEEERRNLTRLEREKRKSKKRSNGRSGSKSRRRRSRSRSSQSRSRRSRSAGRRQSPHRRGVSVRNRTGFHGRRSPVRRSRSRSVGRWRDRSRNRRPSQVSRNLSQEQRQTSRSPVKANPRSRRCPYRSRSRSPAKKRTRSPDRRYSRSPTRGKSRSNSHRHSSQTARKDAKRDFTRSRSPRRPKIPPLSADENSLNIEPDCQVDNNRTERSATDPDSLDNQRKRHSSRTSAMSLATTTASAELSDGASSRSPGEKKSKSKKEKKGSKRKHKSSRNASSKSGKVSGCLVQMPGLLPILVMLVY